MKSMIWVFVALGVLSGYAGYKFYFAKQRVSWTTEALAQDISPTEAFKLSQNSDIIFLDIRTPREFRKGNAPRSVLIDYNSKNFSSEISKLDRQKTYIVYCAVGGRSENAMPEFESLGFENILHMPAGFRGWKQAGLPVSKP